MVESKPGESAPADDSALQTVIARPGSVGLAPGDDRAHYLVVVEGEEPGRRIELGEKHVVIGRMKPADLVITDTLVSRSHCRVGLIMGELFVTDQGSSNGTYVAGSRISGPRLIAPGERFTVGSHVFEHDWRSRKEIAAARAQDSDLDKAKAYVFSLLPERLEKGPVQTNWVLQSSARLGGDLLGYHFIDERTFAIYLLDVTGHGIDAAMHGVSVMNVLRQTALPGVDAHDPARMATYLNETFQMDRHGGMLLSLWYGVFDLVSHTVIFTSAGHHAAYLVGPDRRDAVELGVSNVLIGMMPDYDYRNGHAQVAPGSSVYLFSDGVFEIEAVDGQPWGLGDFVSLLTAPRQPGKPEAQRLLETVQTRTGRQSFEDDFTLVVAAIG